MDRMRRDQEDPVPAGGATTSERPGTPARPDVAPPPRPRHRTRRERIRWNLVGCALHDHRLVGTDAAVVGPDDHDLARPSDDGRRLHRCLRCDAWVERPVPAEPRRERFPRIDEIDLPLRDRALRDRYVLRLIALERLLHVAFFSVVGVALLYVARNRDTLDTDIREILTDLRSGAPVRGTGLLAEVGDFFSFSYTSLYWLAGVALSYAAFEAVEAVGLWRGRRWAEYLTFTSTVLLMPLEVLGLADGVSPLKLVTFVLNAVIVVYLLVSKGLFGIGRRGRRHPAPDPVEP